jgi:polar amino acid transport system substrate-binding protein
MGLSLRADLTQDIQSIKDKGELVVAMHSKDQPPFYMTNKSGELIGFDVEVAKEIAKRLKVKLRFDRTAKTFDDVFDVVAQGNADIGISMLSFTPRRGLKVLFSKPYFKLHKAGLINRVSIAKEGEVSIEELLTPSKKEGAQKPIIGVLQGTSYVRFVRVTFPDTEVTQIDEWKELIEKVKKGDITAIFSDSNDIKLAVSQDPNLVLEVKAVLLKDPDNLYIVYSKKYPDLPRWIDLVLENNEKFTISYDQLVSKYKPEMQGGS